MTLDQELRLWVAAMWDDHLERCGLEHTKDVARSIVVEQFARILEVHAKILAADLVERETQAIQERVQAAVHGGRVQ